MIEVMSICLQHLLQYAILDAYMIKQWRMIHPLLRDLVDDRIAPFSVALHENPSLPPHPFARIVKMQYREECPWSMPPQLAFIQHLELHQDRSMTDSNLITMPLLKTLILPKNKFISDKGIAPLRHLTVLNLQHNRRITDDGIKNKTCLISFRNDWSNKLTDNAFGSCTHLQYLNLGYNNHPRLHLAFLHKMLHLRQFVSLAKKTFPLTAITTLQRLQVVIMPRASLLHRSHWKRCESLRICITQSHEVGTDFSHPISPLLRDDHHHLSLFPL
jgi:hypothetical protein